MNYLFLCMEIKNQNKMTSQIEALKEKELLTAEEAKLVFESNPDWAAKYLFLLFWDNSYLNLNVYSEVEKEAFDLQKEIGF